MKFGITVFTFLCSAAVLAQSSARATVADAQVFMKKAESRMAALAVKVNRANWVHDNFITDDTQALAADANDELTAVTTELVEEGRRYEGLKRPEELARKFMLLKLALTAPAPKDPKLRRETSDIAVSLASDYGKAKYCRKPDDCLDITAIERIMQTSANPEELKELWVGWHNIGAPMRKLIAGLWNSRTRVRAKSDSKTRARCGARITTCRRTSSAAKMSGSGSRCGRCILRCTRS